MADEIAGAEVEAGGVAPWGPQPGEGGARPAARGPRPWLAVALVFLAAAPLLWAFYSRHPLLYDTDSSYHLALARATGAADGVLREFPAVRFSALTVHGFTDAVWLFHVLLAPFAGGEDPLAGGRLALALFDALLLAAIAGLACRAVGWWGLLAPLWLGLGSLETAWRLVRLRPELLSFLLLLLALAAAASGRHRRLGLIAALYSLSYVAWHAFLGIFLLLFGLRGLLRRRWEWPLALYATLGTLAGLALHPHFPGNLLLWKLVAFDFLRYKGSLDAGTETGPAPVQVMLLANLGFWALGAAIWWSRERRAEARPDSGDAGAESRATGYVDAFGLAAFCFAGLYLMMERFALYVFPLAGLWLLFFLARRGETIGPRVRLPLLPSRPSLPLPVALGLVALLFVPGFLQELGRFARRTDAGPGRIRLTDRIDFGRALPAGATVAAPWGDTSIYLLHAPQGRYLNVLDPVAMAVPFPRAYAAQRALFDGVEPDVPLASFAELDSRFVAWSLPGAPPRLLARLRADPRAQPLHLGFQALFALAPARPGTFVLDWKVTAAPDEAAAAPGAPPFGAGADAATLASLPDYPLHPEPAARALEGFVDAGRVAAGRCVAFARPGSGLAPGSYELAAAGPTALWRDGELLVSIGGSPGAVLGEGVRFRLEGEARPLSLVTCPGDSGRAGFYLLPRP